MTTISGKLRAVMTLDPDALVIDHNETWYSWARLRAGVDEITALLEANAVPPGGRVGVFLHNRPGHVAAILAVLATDRCLVTLNPLYPDAALAQDLEVLGVPVIIGEPADLDRPAIAEAIKHMAPLLIEIGAQPGGVRQRSAAGSAAFGQATADGVAIEMLTSGTTGKPKRVPLSRKAFDASFAAVAAYEGKRSAGDPARLRDSATLIINPVTHIGGIYGVIGALMAGRRICLVERFSVETWARAVLRHRPKVAPGVPSALRMILEADLPKETFSSLSAIISGTAPLDPRIVDEFLARYDLPVLGNYGATEFAGAVAGWSLKDFRLHWTQKRGAAGRLHQDVTARIVDPDTGEPLALGAEGLLELKAPQIGDMQHWRRTTDRAVLDADRFLFIRGRADNAILRGGFKVHPDDVVRQIELHPAVREAAVVGLPDARLGEVPAAAIILAEGAIMPPDTELREFLKDRLLPYQVPVRFLEVSDVPRTASMKPAVLEIRQLFLQATNPKGETDGHYN
jgi:acyl-coenzyme A synthetase/AMP-(fatty) acid ligase